MLPILPLALVIVGALMLLPRRADASVKPANAPDVVLGAWELPPTGAPYADTIEQAALANDVPERLLGRLLYQESRFRTDIIDGRVRSSAGAVGIAQFMPATADELGIDPLNPDQAINGCAQYLRKLYDRFGNWRDAIAAYNWGQGNVSRKGVANAPLETRNYIREILIDVFGSETV